MRLLLFPALVAVCWSTIVVLVPAKPINPAHIQMSATPKVNYMGQPLFVSPRI